MQRVVKMEDLKAWLENPPPVGAGVAARYTEAVGERIAAQRAMVAAQQAFDEARQKHVRLSSVEEGLLQAVVLLMDTAGSVGGYENTVKEET